MNQFQFELQRCQGLVEVNLAAYFTQNVPQKTLLDAMRWRQTHPAHPGAEIL